MKKWKEFEKAVSDFLGALKGNNDIEIEPNVYKPDCDTGTKRQCDIWVSAKICKFIKISILISCKRQKRKLNINDVDTFVGEMRASGANKGVIFSYSGFSQPAV